MKDYLYKYALEDKLFFPNIEFKKKDSTKLNKKSIGISTDPKFRKEEFIKGVEVPSNLGFDCDLKQLSDSQRQKLWDSVGENNLRNNRISLRTPKYNNQNKQLSLDGAYWQARINPLTSTPEEIFNAWEIDYDKALEEAQEEQEKALSEGENNGT